MANAKLMTVVGVIVAIAAVTAVGVLIWSVNQAPTAADLDAAVEKTTTTSTLTGKPATISVDVRDGANDNAQIAAQYYIINNAVVGDDEITGQFAADGTQVSTSGRTDSTSGINVGGKYVAIASNSTYFGFPTEEMTVKSQADLLDLVAYTTTSAITERVEDENGVEITDSGTSNNLTLAADGSNTISLIQLKQTTANKALNVAGIYFDKVAGSNISTIEVVGSDTPALTKSTSLNLARTEADDIIFLFDAPILLKEQESINIDDAIKVTANSVGCGAATTESLTLYTLDKVWVKSSIDSNKMIYAYETDAATEADVGLADPSFTIPCAAT